MGSKKIAIHRISLTLSWGENDIQKALENNNYFTRYMDMLEKRIKKEDESFWEYLKETYFYVFKQRKFYEHKYFYNEGLVIIISFLIAVVNAINLPLLSGDSESNWRWILTLASAILAAFVTYIQARISKRKYHECWIRHNNHYIFFIKECRDYAEGLGEYSKKRGAKKKLLKLFIKNIYRIEDNDLDQFNKNTMNLKQTP